MFFPNWGPAESWVMTVAVLLAAIGVVILILTVIYMWPELTDSVHPSTDVGFILAIGICCIALIAGPVAIVGGAMESGRNFGIQERSDNRLATKHLEEAGFDVVKVYGGAGGVILRDGRCSWDYRLEQRDGRYVPMRGSGNIVGTPPVEPDEIGRDDPVGICTRPA